MKTMKNKLTMFFAAVLFVLALTPAVKAEAYGVDQIAAGTNDATVSWNPDTSSYLKGWYVYLNGSLVATLDPGVTTYTFTGLTQGYPYAVKVDYVYQYNNGSVKSYAKGSTIVRTAPSKVKETDVIWKQNDYIDIYAYDSNIYTLSDGNSYLYADGFEFVIKDKNGKKKKTIDSNNSTSYGGGNAYFSAPSALKNKGMQYTIRAYITLDNGQKVYGEAVTKVAVPQAKVTKLKRVGSSKIKVTWKKVSGASSYTIYRTTNSGKTLKKIKKVSKNTTSYTVNRSYMNSSKKGIVIVANNVKIGKKKYNSIKSYYTYAY